MLLGPLLAEQEAARQLKRERAREEYSDNLTDLGLWKKGVKDEIEYLSTKYKFFWFIFLYFIHLQTFKVV